MLVPFATEAVYDLDVREEATSVACEVIASDPGGSATAGSATLELPVRPDERGQVRRALTKALKRQKERLAHSEAEAVDVQLLGQVTSAEEWPKLLAYWERRNPSGVASWPRRLDPGARALNLWPLAAGRVGRGGRTRGRCTQAPAKDDALRTRPDRL